MSAAVAASPGAHAPHRYAVRPAESGWAVTRDDRPVGTFATETEALAVAARITHDIARAGVDVEFAAPEGARW